VILHEQANQGRTIIEKFEHHGGSSARVAVVVALMSGLTLNGATRSLQSWDIETRDDQGRR
jgi:hypothetical protein